MAITPRVSWYATNPCKMDVSGCTSGAYVCAFDKMRLILLLGLLKSCSVYFAAPVLMRS